MTYIERAIKDAVEKGGYEDGALAMVENATNQTDRDTTINICLLDPLFWSALGQARGWKGSVERTYNCSEPNEASFTTMKYACYQQHNFIDHLATGGTAESFFEEIYKT